MMYQKYYEDISKYKYINNKWLFDISIKKWDLRIANSQDLWLMFKLTKRPAWLIKMIMIIVFKDKTYNIIGKINKNET
jgi:hypothetical protein